MADDVQLTDLEVIQRWSLAVRGARAPREELIASLQADLDWLRDGRPEPVPTATTRRAPVRRPVATLPATQRPATQHPAAQNAPGA